MTKSATPGNELFLAREFARKTGVTVRTLHHYDRLGLLRPHARTAAGYRLYGKSELERLEQIVSLKYLGFSLQQIRELLKNHGGATAPKVLAAPFGRCGRASLVGEGCTLCSGHLQVAARRDLAGRLRLQRQIMEERRRRLDQAIHAIAAAEQAAAAGQEPDWDAFRHIIEVIHMQQDTKWVEKYYTPEQLAVIRSGEPWTKQRQEQINQQWQELGKELEAAAEARLDAASEEAQHLVDRYQALIAAFTKGDAGVVGSLRKMYADRANWPSHVDWKLPFNQAAHDWIGNAIRQRGQNCD